MTETRRRHEQRGLNFVTADSFQQLRQQVICQRGGVRNKPSQTPEDRIELANDPVLLEFKESRQRHLCIDVFLNGGGVIATRSEAQVFRFDLRRYFAKSEI